ncbi:MAG: mandelate racemase/muconate lactonizing enzyme family protein [Proteobacteria bacterium]|nr:mandelate racemase/muconate lactonizing enzyme family protein [Pseudomonadota bacterium]
MKITGIETFCLAWRMPYAIAYAKGEYQDREAVLVKVSTDDPDIVGWGESAVWGGPHGSTVAVIEQEIAPLVIGQDPRRPEHIWDKVFHGTYMHGRKGMVVSCLSGIDIACWDIMGKAAGQPLWRLLGGYGRPVTAYHSSGYYRRGDTPEIFAARVAQSRALGYRGYKMKIGNIPQVNHHEERAYTVSFDEDMARIAAAREAIGADRNLMVDANCALNPRVAMRYAEKLEPLEIRWFEEPVAPENIAGCAELAGRTRIAIAGFESETTAMTFARLMDAGAIQIAQPDVVQVGGLTEFRKIAAYAGLRNLHVTGKNYSTAVGQAATLAMIYAVPHGDYFEDEADPLPWRNEIVARPYLTLEDGLAAPTDEPGLGLAIDEAKLQPWLVKP